MIIKEEIKKRLNTYSKDELIEAILLSAGATAFVLTKCKELNGSKPKQEKKPAPKKEAAANDK